MYSHWPNLCWLTKLPTLVASSSNRLVNYTVTKQQNSVEYRYFAKIKTYYDSSLSMKKERILLYGQYTVYIFVYVIRFDNAERSYNIRYIAFWIFGIFSDFWNDSQSG
jgi:hypothetical protein